MNLINEKDNMIDILDNLCYFDRIVTIDGLRQEVEAENKAMSDKERSLRNRDCDPTFLTYCLSLMSLKKCEKALINEWACTITYL